MSVFDAELPTTTCLIRGETVEERARALAKTKGVAKAGPCFRVLKTMMFNGAEVRLSRRYDREKMLADKRKTTEALATERALKLEAARKVYDKHCQGTRLTNQDLKNLLKFICPEEGRDDANNPSQYSTRNAMLEHLSNCTIPWQQYFMACVAEPAVEPVVAEAEDEVEGDFDLGDIVGHDMLKDDGQQALM